MNWHGKRYYSFDSFLKNYFGEKIYKVSLMVAVLHVQIEMEHLELAAVFSAVKEDLEISLLHAAYL